MLLGVAAIFALLAWLRGVPLESRDKDGRTPLQRATVERDHDEMRRLLAAGADPDSTTLPRFRHWRDLVNLQGRRWDHSPPLELSARACDPAGLEILIDGGAVNAKDSIEGAVEASCEPALALLLDRLRPPALNSSLLLTALVHREPESLRLLLEAGANPDQVLNGSIGLPALPVALGICSTETHHMARRALGIWRYDDGEGRLQHQHEMVRLLAVHSSGLDQPDPRWSLTPLDMAAFVCRDGELSALLRQAGATASGGADAQVRGALLAADRDALDAALEAGGDPDQQLPDGRSLLQWAGRNDALANPLRDALTRKAAAASP